MFDIILPVRNRFETFEKTYYSCLKFIKSDSRLDASKIIIIDNNSNDIPEEFILSLPSIVKYINFNERLPMNENWQRALNFLNNDYFTYVGSDDALIFDKLSIDIILMNQEVDCFFWNKYSYFWKSALYENSKPTFNLPLNKYNTGLISTSKVLNDIFNGFQSWNILPTVYNSFFSIRILKKFNSENFSNKFFWNIPDISSGMNVINLCEEVFYLENALGISGISKFSNGFSCFKKIKNLETKEFANDNKKNNEHFSSLENIFNHPLKITAELFIKSLSLFKYKYIKNLKELKEQAKNIMNTEFDNNFNPSSLKIKLLNKLVIPDLYLQDIEFLSSYLKKLFLLKNKFYIILDNIPFRRKNKLSKNSIILNYFLLFFILFISRTIIDIERFIKRNVL